MRNDWLIMPGKDFDEKDTDACSKLSDIMNQIDEGRGWRFTEEQAHTLAKLVDGLVKQVKTENRTRNQQKKRFAFLF